MSIRNKLILTFFAFSMILTFTMGGLMKWSFHHGFSQYIQNKQEERLQVAAPILERFFDQQESWELIRQKPKTLLRLLSNQSRGEIPEERHRLPPPEKRFLSSIYLLDSNRQLVSGHYDTKSKHMEVALKSNNADVGYLGFTEKEKPFTHIERRFEERQGRSLFYVIAVSLFFSLVFSWPLSAALIRKVQLLADHIRQLSQGNYSKYVNASSDDELTGLSEHLNHLGKTLQQSEHARRKLVADVSHELRTPLATLKAQLEAIEDGVHQYNDSTHNRLKGQVSRLNTLVDDLYTLSLSDIGAMQYHKKHCNLSSLLGNVRDTFQTQFEQAGIKLNFVNKLAPQAYIFGDEQRLTQLLSNILRNSLQYTEAPGTTQVEIIQQGANYYIHIEDSAPGVEPSHRERLLERLYRADSSRNRSTGGAGLGLSLCKNIVEAHEGRIEILESKLGGLKVSILLPMPNQNTGDSI